MLRRVLPPLLISLLALGAFQWKIHQKMVDFNVYRQASARALKAEPLYRETDGHFEFKYLPVFAMATTPFAIVDADTAKILWFALSVGALVFLLRFSARFVPDRRRSLGLLMGISCLFLGKFYVHELLLGQVNLVFGLLAVAAVGALQSEVPAVAGVLFGAAICVKPYGVVFAPWLLASEDRRAVYAFAIAAVVALLAPAMIYGVRGNVAELQDWWHIVTSSTAPNLLGTDNISFGSMWAKWIGPGRGATVMAGLTALGTLLIVADTWWRRRHVNEPAYLEVAALLVLVPVLSPQGWDYVLLLATPALVVLIDRLPEVTRPWRIATWTAFGTMGFVIYDVVGRTLYRGFMALSIVSLCAILVVVLLNHLRRLELA